MGKKRKAADRDEPMEREIVFDPSARLQHLTSFRKRKQDRRKRARIEELEKERNERIEVQRSHREDIKKRWKDVLWAERTVDRVMDKRAALALERKTEKLAMLKDGEAGPLPLALKDMQAGDESEGEQSLDDFDTGGDNWMPALEDLSDDDERKAAKPVTVDFGQEEEDDPFGGCEVVTTAVALPKVPGQKKHGGRGDSEDEQETSRALVSKKYCDTLALATGKDGKPLMTAEELAEHRRKRAAHLRREERRRQAAMEKKRKKMEQERKKMKKTTAKGKLGCKGKKAAKTNTRTRRRRMKGKRGKAAAGRGKVAKGE